MLKLHLICTDMNTIVLNTVNGYMHMIFLGGLREHSETSISTMSTSVPSSLHMNYKIYQVILAISVVLTLSKLLVTNLHNITVKILKQ